MTYHTLQERQVTLGRTPITIVTKPGVPDSDHLAAGVALCAEQLHPAADEQIAVFGSAIAPLGVILAQRAAQGRLLLVEPHVVAAEMARLTLQRNQITNAALAAPSTDLPAEAGHFDRVIILAPQSRALARRWIVEAIHLLRPGGTLNIAGANTQGVRPTIADAEACLGPGQILGYGGGGRLAAIRRAPHLPAQPAWTKEAGIAAGSWLTLNLDLPTGPLSLRSLPGIFSADRLDAGTALLLRHLHVPPHARVLDVGCGYGVIGIAAARAGAAHVDLSDVNLLAVAAAQANVAALNLAAAVHAGDALAAIGTQRYDLIVSNPPFHSGRAVDTAMATAFITHSRAHLTRRGKLLLVANRFLPYDRLMAEQGLQVTISAEDRSYRVLSGTPV